MSGKPVKIAIIVVCLAAAAAIFFYSNGPESIPDTDDSKTNWMCAKCRHTVALTAAEVADELARTGGSYPLVCSSCGAKEVYPVVACIRCGTLYFQDDVPGSDGRCPKCFPPGEYVPPPPEVDENGEKAPPSV